MGAIYGDVGGPSPEESGLRVDLDGAIFNASELSAELGGECSDSELVLRAYKRWGNSFLERLNGTFALAIWDGPARTLLLARDRIGEKTLFYFRDGARVVFASEIKAILADETIARRVEPLALANYVTFGHSGAERTMFAGILPLPAGHVLVARDGRVKIDSWWDVPRDEVSSSSEAELADELRALLDDSVKRRLPEDSAVGVFLSGGVDSAAVTALSRRHTGTVKTFSLGFEEGGVYDELDDARRTAALLGTHHHELRVGHPELHERLDALNEHFDEPLGIASGFNMFVLGALAREEGVRVVMTGDGGDELFGGYRRHVADQFASAYQRLPRPLIEGAVPAALARLPRLGRTKQIASTLPIVDPVARSVAWLEVLTPELRAELLQPGAAAGAVHHPTQVFAERAAAWNGAGGSLSRQLYVELKEWLPGTVFDRTARATTAHRLETRMPLFDHRIVAFAFRTPDRLKIRALATQRLLRRALHDVVPAHTLRKRKRGFTTPVDPWFRGPLAPFVREILLDERTRWRGYFDSHVVERLWNEHASGRRIWDRALWLLMTFELWHRAHVDRVRS